MSPVQNQAATMMQYEAQKKSAVVGYLLWWFLGYFGAHRFYMGRVGSGIAMAVLAFFTFILMFVIIGFFLFPVLFVWWVVDAFLLNSWITIHNSALAQVLSED